MKKFIRHLRLPVMLFLAVFATVLHAEDEDFSPWEAWRQGFSYYDKAEKAKEKGETEQALELFSKSRKCYLDVKKARPEWNQKIIGSRISMCEKEIDELKNKISAKRIADKGDSDSTPSSTQTSYSSSEDSASGSQELDKYKKKLFAALIELDELRRQLQRSQTNTTEIENLMREKRVLQEKINLLEQKCASLQEKSLQPDSEKSEMKNRLIEEKMKVDIANQKLQMEQNQTEKLRQELAELYKAQTVLKYSQQEALQRQNLLEKDLQTLQKQKSDYSNERESFLSKINQLTIENTQAQAGMKDKQLQLEKLKKWTDDLQQKGGDQSKLNNEVMAENEKVRAKYEALKTENEKNIRDIQILKDASRETNINMTQLKDTLKRINDQKNQLVDEYKKLQEQYNQRTISESVNGKELQNIRMRNMKLEQDLKMFAEKYETIQKRLENRASSEYQNILAINQQQKEITDKLTTKTIEFEKLNTQHAMLSDKLQNREKTIKEISADLQELKNENRTLKLASQSLTEQNSKLPQLQSECANLKKTIEELKKEQADLAGVNEKYQKALDDLKNFKETQTSNLALQKLNQELADDNRKLKLALDDFQKAKNDLSSAQGALKELAELKAANQALMQKCTVYADKYSVLSDSSKKLTEKLLTAKEENMNLSEKYLQLNNSQEKLSEQTLKFSKQIEVLTVDNIKLREQNKRQQEAASQKDKELQPLLAKVNQLTENNKQLATQADKANSDEHTKLKQTINLQLEELKKNADALQQKNQSVASLQTTIEQLKQENERQLTQKENILKLQEQNKILQQRTADYNKLSKKCAEQENLKNELHRLQITVKNFDEQNKILSGKNAGNEQISAQFEKVNTAKRQVEQQLTKIETDNLNLKNEILTLQNKLTSQKTDSDNATIGKYRSALAAKENDLNAMTAKLESALKNEADYKNSIASLTKNNAATNKKLESLSQQQKNTEEQFKLSQQKLAEINGKIIDQQKQVAEYQLKLSSSQNKNKEYAEKLSQYSQQTTDSKQQLNTFNTQKQKYMTMLRNLEIQLNSRENTIKELTLQKDRLNQQTNELDATTKKLREQIQVLSKKTTTKVVFKESKLPENRINQELKNGIKAEKGGSTEVAIWHYRKILETNPEHVETNRRLGLTLLNREQYSEAVNYLQKAYILKENSVENAIAYSQALAGLKKYGNAYSILQKALKNNPDNPELLTEYGIALTGIGKTSEAKKTLSAALKISPDSIKPNLMMATVIAQNEPKQLDDAVKYYRKARKLGAVPDAFLEKTLAKKLADNAEMLEFLSQAAKEAEKHKDWTSAAWYYNQLTEIEPDNQDYTNRTGMIYILQKNQEKALNTLSLKNNNITGALLSGAAAAMSGKPNTALKYYRLAHDWNSSQKYKLPQYLLQTVAATEQAFKKLAKTDKSGDAAKAYTIFQELVKK